MPAENIERAIKKGLGADGGGNFEELVYEIYGPHGVALLVELQTDNRNRTAAEIRSIVTKHGGSIATPGSVSRLFHRKGQLIVARDGANEDQVMGLAVDLGAEDFKADEHGFEILTDPQQFESVHKRFEERSLKCEVAEITSLPVLTVPLTEVTAIAAVQKLIDALEDHDDVKELFSNAEFPERTTVN